MPFTFSHPAIVLPLFAERFKLSVTGLIIGSMVPDFEFFIKMAVMPNIGHHFWGIFSFDIPVALLLCFVYHNLIKHALIANTPNWFSGRLLAFDINWNVRFKKNILAVCISIIVGILSHLLWDSFTHIDGFFVLQYPQLSNPVSVFGKPMPVYLLLQIVFSVFGLITVFYYFRSLPICFLSTVKRSSAASFWMVLLGIAIVSFVARFKLMSAYNSFWGLFMASMGCVIGALIITSIIFKKNTTTITRQG